MLDRSAARGDVLGALEAAAAAGVDWVQVREREMEGRALLEYGDAVCEAARRAARASDRAVRVLVNRRIDVALAAGADGVHLGFDGVDPGTARHLLGPDALVGVSCHTAAEVHDAGDDASYAQLAPIFPPLSKAATRPALGPAALREASRHREVAQGGVAVAQGGGVLAQGGVVLAQGGVDAGNAAACVAAGAAGVAVTGAILMADDPAQATRALRRALDGAASGGAA